MTGELPAAGHSRISRPIGYAAIVCVGLGAAALYLLSTATANTTVFTRYFPALLAVNGALVLVLAGLVIYQLVGLGRRLRKREFGSRLAVRFVLLFALMALLPGVLLYAVSVKFLARSIDSWFETQVDKALDGGLNLGRGALDNVLKEFAKKADQMADQLSRLSAAEQAAALDSLRQQAQVREAVLFTQRGRIVSYAGSESAGLVPETLSPAALRQTRQLQRFSAIEAAEERGLFLRAISPVGSPYQLDEARALQIVDAVPSQLAADAENVRNGYREYQELRLARVGLKRLYGVTLTLALLVALLSAFLLAFILSARLAAPLLTLAQGTRAVAQGDFNQHIPVESSDELGVLSESFNTMTRQLAQARQTAREHEAQISTAKVYLESVLANLSAGVISFDREFRLRSANPSASAILEFALEPMNGQPLNVLVSADKALDPVREALESGFAQHQTAQWERQVTVTRAGREKVLLIRGTLFHPQGEGGYLVVFDDISHVISAQRHAAWSEVARRLAHEIKNPLTPIQLSAERMQLKLAPHLAPAEVDMLSRSTKTIVEQVAALKSMVDAFSQYARSPEPKLQWLDINQLTREILALYETLGRAIELKLQADLPLVQGDARLLRQVFHNLIQNAQDAMSDLPSPHLLITSEDTGHAIRVSIADNGCGFPEQLMRRVFEPYVTTKQKGTGLGLSIVKKIIEDHGGSVAIENLRPRGARITIDLPRRTPAGPRALASA